MLALLPQYDVSDMRACQPMLLSDCCLTAEWSPAEPTHMENDVISQPTSMPACISYPFYAKSDWKGKCPCSKSIRLISDLGNLVVVFLSLTHDAETKSCWSACVELNALCVVVLDQSGCSRSMCLSSIFAVSACYCCRRGPARILQQGELAQDPDALQQDA